MPVLAAQQPLHTASGVKGESVCTTNCTAPGLLSPCMLYFACASASILTEHGHMLGPKGNGVAETGVEAG